MRGKFTFDGRVVLHRLAEPVKKEEEKLGKYLGLRFRGGPGADIVRRQPQPAAWERILARLCRLRWSGVTVGFAGGYRGTSLIRSMSEVTL